jgi:hypothetical protein
MYLNIAKKISMEDLMYGLMLSRKRRGLTIAIYIGVLWKDSRR